MKLNPKSIQWAIEHLLRYSDTDLFPRPLEFDVLGHITPAVVNKLKDIDFGNYEFGPARRFIVPKDEISYRTATQLDPLDSIMLTAVLYEYGHLIEARRIQTSQGRVFAYRFAPDTDLRLYHPGISWREFWVQCREKASQYTHVTYIDIADFYNQIYHHNIENLLVQCGLPNQIMKWIMGLLENVTVKVSRGIPVGPHATHLLGEMSLIPVDNSLTMKGLDYCRYADDFVVFRNSYKEARITINHMAEMLDKQQRLIMQRQKTRIYNSEDFIKHCDSMLHDRPINNAEEEVLEVLRNHTNNPYTTISIDDLTEAELEILSKTRIEEILLAYMSVEEPNYARLRWLLRRLSQIGIPSAIEFCINRIVDLTPAISEVCHYLIAACENYDGDLKDLGANILQILSNDLIKSNEYFQVALLSPFSRNILLNNTSGLLSVYQSSPASLKREILLSAFTLDLGDWIRELKESYATLDTWCKRAFIIAAKSLPTEERRFFLDHIKDGSALNELLIKWAKQR